MYLKSIYLKLFLALVFVSMLNGCSSIDAAMRASPSLANAVGMATIPVDDLKARYTNEYSHWVEIGGLNVHYEDEGQGPVIVLVHGIMSSLQTWDDWTDVLKNNYRVIRLDLPGYGLTGAPKDISKFNESYLLNSFSKFIDDLNLKKFTLVGNSLGGYISAQYAATHPEKVQKLVLIDPIGYPQKLPWILNLATKPVISQIAKYYQPPVLIALNVKDVYGDPRRLTKKNLDRYVRMAQRPGATMAYYKTIEMLKARSKKVVPLPFSSIAAPTLLMWGGKDHWVPENLSKRWLTDIQGSKLVVYPTAGHVPMEEIPQKTVADFIAFMNNEPLPSQVKPSKEKTDDSSSTIDDSSSSLLTTLPTPSE
jgi:pimeloyl-ACP methyl ester carboxylesterase